MSRSFAHAGALAGLIFVASALLFSLGLDGYSHRIHPVGLLGAQAMPYALAFNVAGFAVPGLLAAWVGLRLRDALSEAGWPARIGAWLAVLAALAFAAQGLLRLDPADLESAISRLHGVAWMLWWLAFVPGAALLAFGLRSQRAWRGLALASAAAAIAVAAFAMGMEQRLPTAIAHRIAFAAWFVWLAYAGYVSRRGLAGSEARAHGAIAS